MQGFVWEQGSLFTSNLDFKMIFKMIDIWPLVDEVEPVMKKK